MSGLNMYTDIILKKMDIFQGKKKVKLDPWFILYIKENLKWIKGHNERVKSNLYEVLEENMENTSLKSEQIKPL